MKLTIKQEKFCQLYIETGNASAAYRQSYNTENMKPESVNRLAKDLIDNIKITSRINELKGALMERHKVTVDSLIIELEEARKAALTAETPQSSAAVAATMGKAKLCGLDKQLIEQKITYESMSDEEIERKLLELGYQNDERAEDTIDSVD